MATNERTLASLDELRHYQGVKDGEETSADAERERLLDDASDEVYLYTGREFKLLSGANPQTRTFDSATAIRFRDASGIRSFLPIGDAYEIDAVAVAGTVVDLASVGVNPPLRRPWKPIRHLVFPDGYLSGLVGVTGSFGFEEVPGPIRQATIVIAAYWMARDVSKWSETFRGEEGAVTGGVSGRAIPRQAWDLIDTGFRSVSLGG